MTDTSGVSTSRPVPIVQPESQAYWDGARQGRLVLQRCRACAAWVHPPRFSCPSCLSGQLAAAEATGHGTVFAWSVMHQRGVPGFDEQIPYAVVLIELAEQPGLLAVGQVVDCAPEELRVGMPVNVCFEERGDIVVPQWRRGR
jgi:uncharacterized OB-fold protein